MQMMSKLAEEIRISEEQMMTLLHQPVKVRLARLLLYLVKTNHLPKNERNIAAGLQRTEMAQIIGATPETLSRSLAAFASRGLINLDRTAILLKDKEALKKVSGRNTS